MSRSEVRGLSLATALVALSASVGCADVVGMHEVVVVDDLETMDDVKRVVDGGAASRAPTGSPDVADAGAPSASPPADAGSAPADAGGPLVCSGLTAPTCGGVRYTLDRNAICSNTCDCRGSLWCKPDPAFANAAGRCCASAPCGSPCTTDCDCGSGQCRSGVCR